MSTYRSPAAFRAALEARLAGAAAAGGRPNNRARKLVAFSRLLARLQESAPGQWVLKGGLAMELSLQDRARATRDADLDWTSTSDPDLRRVSPGRAPSVIALKKVTAIPYVLTRGGCRDDDGPQRRSAFERVARQRRELRTGQARNGYWRNASTDSGWVMISRRSAGTSAKS